MITHYLLIYRSLTRTQIALQALQNAGIAAAMTRAPKRLSAQGCIHGLSIPAHALQRAQAYLYQADLLPKKCYSVSMDDIYREVSI